MSRLIWFSRNAFDIVRAGAPLRSRPGRIAEFRWDHRVSSRTAFVRQVMPRGGVGAELGVFTGLFSQVLLRHARPTTAYFVDPWWRAFGETYPDWGAYTGYGRLPTRFAQASAERRIRAAAGNCCTHVRVEPSEAFLRGLPDATLDWVYLDSTHSYEGTRDELALLAAKVKPGGVIAGDDWQEDASHVHGGVAVAVREAVARGALVGLTTHSALQWAARLPHRVD